MATPGFHGRYLWIDLDRGLGRDVPLGDALLREVVGGSGLGTRLLLRHSPRDAIGSDATNFWLSPLVFAFSPLVGSPLTTSAKFAVVSHSPLTQRLNDSLASSGFAISGKATGYDAFVLDGRCDRPSVLVIDHGEVRLEPAAELRDCSTTDAELTLRERFGPQFDFAVIGPAGERQVRYASISHDGRHAGRGGSGAVMGAKNLKAIAVRGDSVCRWHDPDRLYKYARELAQRSAGPATAKYRELGTASNLLAFNRLNTLPTRNFQQASFSAAEQLAPETLVKDTTTKRSGCRACTIGCEHQYRTPKSNSSVRLEYENLFALGPLCGVSDADAVLGASRLCDQLGLDTISTGGSIAFAMECVQRGILPEPWLRFGDGAALLRAIELIGRREGVGDLLAEGTRRAAEQIGGEAQSLAIHVKGMELPGYEPRTLQTMALGYAVGTRGADHNRNPGYQVDFTADVDRRRPADDSVQRLIAVEDQAWLFDSLILCKFLRGVFANAWDEASQMIQMITGWQLSRTELQTLARNGITAKKHYNLRQGWQPSEDTLPARFFDEPLPDDTARLSRQRLGQLIVRYNQQRGWTPDGYPRDDVGVH